MPPPTSILFFLFLSFRHHPLILHPILSLSLSFPLLCRIPASFILSLSSLSLSPLRWNPLVFWVSFPTMFSAAAASDDGEREEEQIVLLKSRRGFVLSRRRGLLGGTSKEEEEEEEERLNNSSFAREALRREG